VARPGSGRAAAAAALLFWVRRVSGFSWSPVLAGTTAGPLLPKPHTRGKSGCSPAPAACRTVLSGFHPSNGRLTGPEPVRAVLSRQPADKKSQ